jgi:hypothetical protein
MHEVPCHHSLAEYLDAWIAAAGIGGDKKGPLFRTVTSAAVIRSRPIGALLMEDEHGLD